MQAEDPSHPAAAHGQAADAAAPLEGCRVVDLTTVLMGPSATQTLAEFGAQVVKVESPEGDLMRGIGPMRNPGMGAIFINVNRGKKSVVLDIKTGPGREALMRLAAGADVFTYNLRPQAMARLGLSWESLSAVNPRLVYVGMFGFARAGPYANRPAYDDIIQGASGIAYLAGVANGGRPSYAPLALADRVTGLAAVNQILAGLLLRARTGRGCAIEVTMFETVARMALADHLQGETFVPAEGPSGYVRQLSRFRKPYQTRDGWVCALIYSNAHWARFLEAIGRHRMLAEDPALAHIEGRTRRIDELYAIVEEELARHSTAEAMALLESIDVPAIPMFSIDDLLRDAHLAATGFFGEEAHPSEGRLRTMGTGAIWNGAPLAAPGPAPRLGEHTREVLESLGYAAPEIDAIVNAARQ